MKCFAVAVFAAAPPALAQSPSPYQDQKVREGVVARMADQCIQVQRPSTVYLVISFSRAVFASRALWWIPSIAKSMTRCCSEKFRREKKPKPSPIVHSRRGEFASGTDKSAVLNFMQKQYGTRGSTLASLSADNCPYER
jgi:hypothetical protein